MPIYISRGSTRTGDISGSFYTKSESDVRYVNTVGNETISGEKIFNDKLTVNSDIEISGSITENLKIEDNIITLNFGETASGITLGTAGIEIDRGTANDGYLILAENTLGSDSDNRWMLDIGDGNMKKILYDDFPDEASFDGDVYITSLTPANSGNVLTWDSNGKLIDGNISTSSIITSENIDASGVPYTPYDETYYGFTNPAVATSFDDAQSALDANSYQSAVSFQTSRNISSTGIISGGEIGVFNSTTIYVSAGRGAIVDPSTVSGPFGGASVASLVEWDSFTVEVPNITGGDYSLLALDSNASPYWKTTEFTPEEHRDYLIIGKVIHRGGTANFTSNLQHRSVDVYNQFVDLAEAIGPLNLTGNVVSEHDPNNTLEITKSAGETFRLNYDSANDIKNPHHSTEALQDPATFFRVYRDGSGGWNYVSGQTLIDPDNYDDGSGTLATTDNNKFTVQRIYMFPGSGRLYVFYGQNIYSSLDIAKEAALNETWEGPPGNFFDATLRAYLIIQEGTSDFADPNSYVLLNAGKFQGGSGDAGSTSLITTFSDDSFAVYYDSQPDKTLSFDLSNLDDTGEGIIISANTSQNGDITLTLPSDSGTIALESDITQSSKTIDSTTLPITSTYTLTDSNAGKVFYISDSAGNIVLNQTPITNEHLWLKNKTSSTIPVSGGAYNLEEKNTQDIPAKTSWHIHFDGIEWWVI